jgi:hypothetical protein
MERRPIEVARPRDLHDLAEIHYGYARADVLDYGEINASPMMAPIVIRGSSEA